MTVSVTRDETARRFVTCQRAITGTRLGDVGRVQERAVRRRPAGCSVPLLSEAATVLTSELNTNARTAQVRHRGGAGPVGPRVESGAVPARVDACGDLSHLPVGVDVQEVVVVGERVVVLLGERVERVLASFLHVGR